MIVIQVCAPTTNAEVAEIEWFYEDLQELLELTPQKKMSFSSQRIGMQKQEEIPRLALKYKMKQGKD